MIHIYCQQGKATTGSYNDLDIIFDFLPLKVFLNSVLLSVLYFMCINIYLIDNLKKKKKTFSFMLFSANNIGRGNVLLKHSVGYFSTNFQDISFSVAEHNVAIRLLERLN